MWDSGESVQGRQPLTRSVSEGVRRRQNCFAPDSLAHASVCCHTEPQWTTASRGSHGIPHRQSKEHCDQQVELTLFFSRWINVQGRRFAIQWCSKHLGPVFLHGLARRLTDADFCVVLVQNILLVAG